MIWQMIEDWFRGILTDGILSNLSGLFDSVNTEVGEIATQVGTTPAGWNAGIFNMIRSLSENVIVPIAGVIITFVMCYELIQLVIEKNNLHDLDTWIFFKWIFKTFVAVLLVTNTWNIVMGVFDVTQSVVNQSAGVIISDTSIDVTTVITDIEAKLDAMSVGGLLNERCPYPDGNNGKSRMGQHGTELLKIFACAWFSGVSDLGVCRHLCGVDTNNRSDRRHFRRDLGLHGLYRPLVLYAFQNGKPCKERLFGTLRG